MKNRTIYGIPLSTRVKNGQYLGWFYDQDMDSLKYFDDNSDIPKLMITTEYLEYFLVAWKNVVKEIRLF